MIIAFKNKKNMSRLFSANINNSSLNFWLLLLRIVVACLMITHGLPKLEKVIAGDFKFADPIGLGARTSLILTVIAEVLCPVLILIGFATRLATIPLIINMTVIVFIVVQDFTKKEFPLLYLLIFITLLVTGAGKYSVDGMLSPKGRHR